MQDIDRGGSRQWACVQFAFNSGGKTVGGQTMTSFWFAPAKWKWVNRRKGASRQARNEPLWLCGIVLIS
jgi:hypothetical protein